jgi:sodium-dependent dicarboxylate transporter 2/3/5
MFLAPFSNDIMFLFMGGFLLSAAVSRHGLDRVIARLCLRPFRRRPMGLLCAVALSSAFLSMWMSNTATAAMLMAVIRPLLQSIPPRDPYRAGLALSVCVGANIGGIGTPIGSPPNAIAFAALRSAGFDITFLGWMAMAIPLALVLLAAGIAILWLFHKPSLEFALHPDTWGDHGQEPRITPMARITLAVLLVAVAGWIFGDYAGISPGVVALIAAAMLTATRALNQHDVDSIDWNVLILIWGGLSLSVAMDVSGLTMMVAAIDMARIPGGPWFIGAALALTAMGMSTFMSNTATAGLLVPMALALGVQDREELAIVAALACSFAMALPVSTPPNAIVHASGAVPLAHMIRNGILIGLLSAGLMLAGYRLVLPLVVKPPLSARQPGGG